MIYFTLPVLLMDIFVLTSSASEVKNALVVLLVGILVLLVVSRRLLVHDTCLLVEPRSITSAEQQFTSKV